MTGIYRLVRIPDVVSLVNSLLGFGSILMAFQERFSVSVVLIILAAVADGLDGFLARRTGTGPLGLDLDSLADLVSFGVAPVVLAWAVFGSWIWALGGVYLICGILRLARFNVTAPGEAFFQGIPITTAGMILALSVLLDGLFLTTLLIVVLSALMISSVTYPKFRDLKYLPFAFLAVLAVLICWLVGDGNLWAVVAFLGLLGYMISPVVITLCRRMGR